MGGNSDILGSKLVTERQTRRDPISMRCPESWNSQRRQSMWAVGGNCVEGRRWAYCVTVLETVMLASLVNMFTGIDCTFYIVCAFPQYLSATTPSHRHQCTMR